MNNTFNEKLSLAASLSSKDYSILLSKSDSVPVVLESDEEIHALSERILALPEKCIHLLLMKYYFDFDDKSIENTLDIPHVFQESQYIVKLLGLALPLLENELISDSSIKSACELAVEPYVERTLSETANKKPYYSAKLRKQLSSIRAARRTRSIYMLIAQRVAAVIVVIAIGFSATLAVNADVREAFFNWVVERFPQFSHFRLMGTDDSVIENNREHLQDYSPRYIPVGYILSAMTETSSSVKYIYENDEGDMLVIVGNIPSESGSLMNTEGATVEEITFLDAPAYYWETNGISYLLWQKSGFEFTIFARENRETIFEIANNIK